MWVGIACAATSFATTRARAEALLVIEADSGRVLYAQNAGQAWYPASVTKLMTAYVTLRAVKEGRLSLDTPLTVSPNAVAQSPVKMGFAVGTVVTVDNALKMLMVKSANDMAVVLAEGVAGSIENFAGEMNANARQLGMIQSSFVNPNGLPADDQVSSARDLAILARALIRELPEYDYYWHLPGIRMGKMVRWNYNTLIGRYPGADGMKTGFICASGFNLVASATRNGRRLIAVVLGAPSSAARALKAAQLLERGFNTNSGPSWLMPPFGTVESVQPIAAAPPNLRDEMCGGHRKRPASEDEDDLVANNNPESPYAVFLASLHPGKAKGAAPLQEKGEPVLVYTGTKPPAPGAQTATESKPEKPEKKKAAAVKPTAKDKDDASPTSAATSRAAPKAKPKSPAAKDGAKDAANDGGSATAAASGDGTAPKPKAKKPAPQPPPMVVTPAADQSSQAK
ncbi:MAG: D-alanyl-D-alanine carboxypeptidase [Hyphomicrobiales bacterium]|jgi:D-alanyl-D-alanine carboxypeptidase|nr:D-alanyl-D-alanine carboxypeptidase [Hyphomicrobiales bacterium]MBV8319402.1 D-alanyl-D-alanine carboxypeptidase [Hyphomicrobiales bacterium]